MFVLYFLAPTVMENNHRMNNSTFFARSTYSYRERSLDRDFLSDLSVPRYYLPYGRPINTMEMADYGNHTCLSATRRRPGQFRSWHWRQSGPPLLHLTMIFRSFCR